MQYLNMEWAKVLQGMIMLDYKCQQGIVKGNLWEWGVELCTTSPVIATRPTPHQHTNKQSSTHTVRMLLCHW